MKKGKVSGKRKNFNRKRRINILIIIILAVVFFKLAMMASEYTPSEKTDVGLAIKLNLDGDFPNPKEGTAIFNHKLLMDRIILQFNKVPKYVIFSESKTIPGLFIRYNLHDSVFEGGLPLIRSEEVTYLDGNPHEVVYTFKVGGEQKFFFDGKEIASSIFDSSKIGITGFTVSGFGGDFEIMDVEGEVEFK